MQARHIENIDRELLDGGCLLCSEDKLHHCHRRLVVEYLKRQWVCVRSYLFALACAHGGKLATFDRRLVVDAVRGGAKALHLIA